MIDLFLILGGLMILTWLLSAPRSRKRRSRETLNEVCPNDNTGNFAVFPSDDIIK